jgi:hypothetical protein
MPFLILLAFALGGLLASEPHAQPPNLLFVSGGFRVSCIGIVSGIPMVIESRNNMWSGFRVTVVVVGLVMLRVFENKEGRI